MGCLQRWEATSGLALPPGMGTRHTRRSPSSLPAASGQVGTGTGVGDGGWGCSDQTGHRDKTPAAQSEPGQPSAHSDAAISSCDPCRRTAQMASFAPNQGIDRSGMAGEKGKARVVLEAQQVDDARLAYINVHGATCSCLRGGCGVRQQPRVRAAPSRVPAAAITGPWPLCSTHATA